MTPDIQRIVVNYLTASASVPELDELVQWLEDDANRQEFIAYVKANYAIDAIMNDFNTDRATKKLLEKIRRDRKHTKVRRLRTSLGYAAGFILLLGLGLLFKQGYFSTQPSVLEASPRQITLELQDGSLRVLKEDGEGTVTDASGHTVGIQQGSSLTYPDTETEELLYNTLTVPYGKRFKLKLSDGTQVHLNAGTSLRYPLKFINGGNRQVFLNGEAYFDVSENKVQPFIVNAAELKVKVLGTEFNVAAYPEDIETDVVLVEGSVGIYTGDEDFDPENHTVLRPGFMGSFNKEQVKVNTKKVNTTIYTSWIKGDIVFRNAPFDNIVKKLERHYDVIIINNNKMLAGESFNASIEVEKETIYQVLDYFKKVYDIEYRIVNNKIVIEQPK